MHKKAKRTPKGWYKRQKDGKKRQKEMSLQLGITPITMRTDCAQKGKKMAKDMTKRGQKDGQKKNASKSKKMVDKGKKMAKRWRK
jgi:hypothetical protein